ncbi:MAG TPA: ABC transporter ATP-binding protein, partial [Solirubrobacteraceae bacterium]|jgi:ABC-type multidrug transport system ATPase subunit|nr:ABC transporter ATP-binding protein [Solirubrobacteraceae bacterium]
MTPRSLEAVATPAPSLQDTAPARGAELPASGRSAAAQAGESACPLALRGVSKRWRKDLPLVLDELDLTLEPGTMTWIGGRNGVGKTTMLRIAAGLIEADTGRAEVWGVSARENRTRYQELVSFLPAGDRGLYARLTVRRQLEFSGHLALVPRARLRTAVEEAIAEFDLRELAERRVDRISMGQRQRLRLAMTFLPVPEIVLLDEPLTSLDGEGAALLERALQQLIAREGAVLWCSPSGEQLDIHFDARFTIEHGRLVAA